MHRYGQSDLFLEKIGINVKKKKSKSWKNKALTKANKFFLMVKQVQKKETKGFFPKKLLRRYFRRPKKC